MSHQDILSIPKKAPNISQPGRQISIPMPTVPVTLTWDSEEHGPNELDKQMEGVCLDVFWVVDSTEHSYAGSTLTGSLSTQHSAIPRIAWVRSASWVPSPTERDRHPATVDEVETRMLVRAATDAPKRSLRMLQANAQASGVLSISLYTHTCPIIPINVPVNVPLMI